MRQVVATTLSWLAAVLLVQPLAASCYVGQTDQCTIVRLVNHSGVLIFQTFVNSVQEGALPPNGSTDAILEPNSGGAGVDGFYYEDANIAPKIAWHALLNGAMDACHVYVFYYEPAGTFSTGPVLTKPCQAPGAGQTQGSSQNQGMSKEVAAALAQEATRLNGLVKAGQLTAAAAQSQLDAIAASYNVSSGDPAWTAWRSQVQATFSVSEQYSQQQQAQALAQQEQLQRQQQLQQQAQALAQQKQLQQQQREAQAVAMQQQAQAAQQRAIEDAQQRQAAVNAAATDAYNRSIAIAQSNQAISETMMSPPNEITTDAALESQRAALARKAVNNWKPPKSYGTASTTTQVALVDPFATPSQRPKSVDESGSTPLPSRPSAQHATEPGGSAMSTVREAYSFTVVSADGTAEGELRRVGNAWQEWQGQRLLFTWEETTRDSSFILLVDRSRGMRLAVPVNGGRSRISGSLDGGWVEWNQMSPITLALQ